MMILRSVVGYAWINCVSGQLLRVLDRELADAVDMADQPVARLAPAPTPAGVPVKIRSPGNNVTSRDR